MSFTEEERVQILKAIYEDPVKFCRLLLPHIFPGEMPWLHRGMLSYSTGRTKFLSRYGEVAKIVKNFSPLFTPMVDGEILTDDGLIDEAAAEDRLTIRINRRRYCVWVIPRGSGKTSIEGIAVPLYEILFQECDFMVYVSETMSHAKMQLENVKRELSSNELILELFGDLRPETRDDERWAAEAFETVTGMFVVARGRGSQIRGLNHRGRRPRKIICDDLEDKESVSTEAQREKTRTWAYGDLLPALKEIGEANAIGELNVMGTLLHPDCLLKTFSRDPQFTYVQFGARDKDGALLWPAWMDEAKLNTKRESAAVAGQLSTFHLEYFSEDLPAELQVFRRDYFVYASPEPTVLRSIYGDPAISKRKTADDAVICVAGVTKHGRFEILDMVGERGMPVRKYIDTYFHLSKVNQPHRHGIEANGYQAALVELFREEMYRNGYFFQVIPITNRTKKTTRIQGILQPRLASLNVNFRVSRPKLESNLLAFNPTKDEQADDWADCLAGAIQLLDASAGVQAGMETNQKEVEPLDSTWRWAP